MPVVYAVGYLVMLGTGRPLPDPMISLASIPVLLIMFFVSAVFDEGGWTGYALDPLQHRWGMVRAALALDLSGRSSIS